MCIIETEKYFVRKTTEEDMRDLKELLKENEYLSLLWGIPFLDEERVNSLVENLYIKMPHNYGIIDKESERLQGYLSFIRNDREGELSVRMKKSSDMCEVMMILSKILNEIKISEKKNLTIQYTFE